MLYLTNKQNKYINLQKYFVNIVKYTSMCLYSFVYIFLILKKTQFVKKCKSAPCFVNTATIWMLISYDILASDAFNSHCDTDANSKLDDGKAGVDSYINIIYLCCWLFFNSIFPVFISLST